MKVKICGLLDEDSALAAARAGADMLGFVFAPSRRRISPARARSVVAAVRRYYGPRVQMVGVFVDACPVWVDSVAAFCSLDYAQLCGHEDRDYLERLSTPAILARPAAAGLAVDGTIFDHPRVAYALLDAVTNDARGGTGVPCDWTAAATLARVRPILLAGGLTPANVGAAIAAVGPRGVDVSSGVETAGRKDPAKIEAFVRRAKAAAVTFPVWEQGELQCQ